MDEFNQLSKICVKKTRSIFSQVLQMCMYMVHSLLYSYKATINANQKIYYFAYQIAKKNNLTQIRVQREWKCDEHTKSTLNSIVTDGGPFPLNLPQRYVYWFATRQTALLRCGIAETPQVSWAWASPKPKLNERMHTNTHSLQTKASGRVMSHRGSVLCSHSQRTHYSCRRIDSFNSSTVTSVLSSINIGVLVLSHNSWICTNVPIYETLFFPRDLYKNAVPAIAVDYKIICISAKSNTICASVTKISEIFFEKFIPCIWGTD